MRSKRPLPTQSDSTRRRLRADLRDMVLPGLDRRDLQAGPIERRAPSIDPRPHWRCLDCGMPCTCTDEAARRAPHLPCGTKRLH